MIKQDSFNNKVSSRLTQNETIIIMIQNGLSCSNVCLFSISFQFFFFFFSNNKGRNSKKLQNRLEFNIYHKKIHENGWKMVT